MLPGGVAPMPSNSLCAKSSTNFAASMCGGLNMCFALQPITISLRPGHHSPMHRYWLQGIDLLLLPLGLL